MPGLPCMDAGSGTAQNGDPPELPPPGGGQQAGIDHRGGGGAGGVRFTASGDLSQSLSRRCEAAT